MSVNSGMSIREAEEWSLRHRSPLCPGSGDVVVGGRDVHGRS
jgi:hypothetical protein